MATASVYQARSQVDFRARGERRGGVRRGRPSNRMRGPAGSGAPGRSSLSPREDEQVRAGGGQPWPRAEARTGPPSATSGTDVTR